MRKLAAYALALPANSASKSQQGWTLEHELAASLIEATDVWGRVAAQVMGADSRKLPSPPQIAHPGRNLEAQQQPPRQMSTDAEIAQFFSRN